MKIILFGIGQGLDLVERKLKKQHEILGYMDSFSKLTIFQEKPFYTLKTIYNLDYDYIVITIRERKEAWRVYKLLIENGVYSKKIIPFYVCANYELYDIKLRNHKLENIKGLIFGNSHATFGYLEENMFVPFLNFAIPSADIYYNYKVFDKCVMNYGEKLNNLQYIIIDMFDYVMFNYDTSLSINTFDYIMNGGYMDEHNFENNKNFKESFEKSLFENGYIIVDQEKKFGSLFNDTDVTFDLYSMERWKHIKKDEPADVNVLIGTLVSKRFKQTIEENISIINKFMQEIRQFCPNVKIVFTLIPRYITMEKLGGFFIESWKKEFYEIVHGLCNKYNAIFFDYKNRKEISENHRFYYDVSHLNTTGGRALTSILNEDLKKIKLN